MSEIHFVIIAGGIGFRMQSSIPKQFIEINNIPIWVHTFKKLYKCVPNAEFTFAVSEQYHNLWNEQKEKFIDSSIKTNLTPSGPRRFHSVKSGLSFVKDNQIVAVHDAVRPFVSGDTIKEGIKMATYFGNAIPAIPINESIRFTDGAISKSANRDDFKIVQTPQFFRSEIILNAYSQQYRDIFTDDASVVEAAGFDIRLFDGNKENIKLTEPTDLYFAETLINKGF